MTNELFNEWQHRRSRLNHDWLKGTVIPRLQAYLTILNSDPLKVDQFDWMLEPIFHDWEQRVKELEWLIANFEECMSPRILIKNSFQKECDPDTVEDMKTSAHELWRLREQPDRLNQHASEALHKVVDLHSMIIDISGAGAEDLKLRRVAWERKPILEFIAACKNLSLAISQYPRDIRII